MPFYNVKFKINASPGVAMIHHLEFGGKPATRAQINARRGTVKRCIATDCLNVDCFASGDQSCEISIDIELFQSDEVGTNSDGRPIFQESTTACKLKDPVEKSEENQRIRISKCFTIQCP